MKEQEHNVDKWGLIYPGMPLSSGLHWGVVTQSGRPIALRITKRRHAEMLMIMGNILGRDSDTIKDVSSRLSSIFDATMSGDTALGDDEDYFVKAVIEAILGAAHNE